MPVITVKDTMYSMNISTAIKAIGSNATKLAISSNLELEAVKKQLFRPQWLIDGIKKTGLGNLTNEEINGVFGIAFMQVPVSDQK